MHNFCGEAEVVEDVRGLGRVACAFSHFFVSGADGLESVRAAGHSVEIERAGSRCQDRFSLRQLDKSKEGYDGSLARAASSAYSAQRVPVPLHQTIGKASCALTSAVHTCMTSLLDDGLLPCLSVPGESTCLQPCGKWEVVIHGAATGYGPSWTRAVCYRRRVWPSGDWGAWQGHAIFGLGVEHDLTQVSRVVVDRWASVGRLGGVAVGRLDVGRVGGRSVRRAGGRLGSRASSRAVGWCGGMAVWKTGARAARRGWSRGVASRGRSAPFATLLEHPLRRALEPLP